METGASILNYTGNANLGLGANTNIPVSAEKPELDAVQQASQNLRLYDHQDNVLKYQQKIADRDKALQLLAQGKVNAGKILPEDQKHYDEAEKAQTEAYKAIKGMQDKDGIANYLSTTQKLQDLVTNAQHRWIEVTKLEDEKAKQSLPKDVQAYADHIAKQRAKPIGELVDPYQSAFSFDDDKLRKGIIGGQMISKGIGGGLPPQEPQTITVTDANGKKTTKTVTAPVQKALPGTKVKSGSTIPQNGELSAFQDTPERFYDLPTMLKRAEQLYVTDPDETENQRQLFSKFHEAPDFIQEDLINKYNDRIRTYNEQRGFNPDDNLIKAKNVGGKFILQETPSSFAAKHTLATIEGDYVEKPQKAFNKDIAEYLLGKEKAGTDRMYKMSMAAAAGKKAGAYVANMQSQIKAREGNNEEQNKFLEEIYTRNLAEQPSLIQNGPLPNGKTTGVQFAPVYNQNSLPLFTFNSNGKPSLLKPFGGEPIMSGKSIVGYKGGTYKQNYIFNGNAIPIQGVFDMYYGFKTDHPEWKFGFDDYLKIAIKNGVFDVKLSGENGSTDKMISREAQRAISNSLTKKGQDAVFEVQEPVIDNAEE